VDIVPFPEYYQHQRELIDYSFIATYDSIKMQTRLVFLNSDGDSQKAGTIILYGDLKLNVNNDDPRVQDLKLVFTGYSG
jgi:hypothetical protein